MDTATHLSFNVADLNATRNFYSKFFNMEPIKIKPDYLKFELDSPAMVISFILNENLESDALRTHAHFGIRLSDTSAVNNELDRLRKEGLVESEEENVACCYAVQDKFWVQDPDGLRWEIYTFKEDTDQLKNSDSNCCETESKETNQSAVACC